MPHTMWSFTFLFSPVQYYITNSNCAADREYLNNPVTYKFNKFDKGHMCKNRCKMQIGIFCFHNQIDVTPIKPKDVRNLSMMPKLLIIYNSKYNSIIVHLQFEVLHTAILTFTPLCHTKCG